MNFYLKYEKTKKVVLLYIMFQFDIQNTLTNLVFSQALAIAGKTGHERMVTSRVSMNPRDRPSREVGWLWAEKNSKASHSKVKAALFRDAHSIDKIQAISEGERCAQVWE